MKRLLSLFPLSLILIASACLLSCSKDDDPGYAGTWQFSETLVSDGLTYNTIRTIILERKSWEETYLIRRENSETITAIIGTKGKLGTVRSHLVFYLEELGTCKLDENEFCTEETEWYGEGSAYWMSNIRFFSKTVESEYELTETTLRLIRDLNDDGDTEDTGEDVTFQLI
jgi:hypothetical protein